MASRTRGDRDPVTALHHEAIQRWLRGHLLCRVPDAGPRFALTFDDGPSPRNTPALLDALARHGAHATFFVMRSRVDRHPEMVQRMRAEGHEVGVHGDWHVPTYVMPRRWLAREIARSAATVHEVAGCAPRHYRAPFGLLLPHHATTVRAHGLVPVLGDVYPRDHALRAPDPIVRRVLARLDHGSIVILHDSSALMDVDRSATIAAVERILEAASQRGWTAVTLEELSRPR